MSGRGGAAALPFADLDLIRLPETRLKTCWQYNDNNYLKAPGAIQSVGLEMK
jgi:hypothetical protein